MGRLSLAAIAFVAIVEPVAAQIPAEHKSATEAATMYHDAISHATDLYEYASIAARCGLMDWPRSFELQRKIQIGELKNVENFANFTDDKEAFRDLARSLLGEQSQRMANFQAVIGQTGVSTGTCLDLKRSGTLDTLNSLSK